MVVHAEYFKIAKTTFVRRKTLLHFGKSTRLIGSAVLINPGSATPIGPANMQLINAFYAKNHTYEVPETEIWHSFRPDATMPQLEKVFNGWYVGQKKPLKGVIQLFNCFYLKQQDLDKALDAFTNCKSWSFAEKHLFKDKPVYFGWGTVGKSNTQLRPITKAIFNTYEKIKTPIYHKRFDDNCFYHPAYLNRSYNHNKKSMNLLLEFASLVS